MVTFGKWRTQRAVRSMYYVGIDGENGLYYLDPHKTQDTIYFNDIRTTQASNFASYHYTLNPKKTKMDQIDPSILIGFYCQNKQDFDNLCERVEKLTKEKSPSIFVISNKRPIYSKELKIEVQDSNDPGLKWKGEEVIFNFPKFSFIFFQNKIKIKINKKLRNGQILFHHPKIFP